MTETYVDKSTLGQKTKKMNVEQVNGHSKTVEKEKPKFTWTSKMSIIVKISTMDKTLCISHFVAYVQTLTRTQSESHMQKWHWNDISDSDDVALCIFSYPFRHNWIFRLDFSVYDKANDRGKIK